LRLEEEAWRLKAALPLEREAIDDIAKALVLIDAPEKR